MVKALGVQIMNQIRKKVLIVDDEQTVRESLQLLLKRHFEVNTAVDGEDALQAFQNNRPDLVLLDVLMPKLDGIETLRRLREKDQTVPVVMLTASNTVKTAVQAMKYGAVDYLSKPFDVEELTSLLIDTLEHCSVGNSTVTNERKRYPAPKADFGSMVGVSGAMRELFGKVQQVAGRDTTILITGESGTGKELVARQIHQLSSRSSKPFIALNCGAIPETLIESELFGHERGAFTSAVESRVGHCELANGGTLFLDEIGELGLPVQVKILRFLQEQEFYRVGSSKSIKVDVRIIAATNKNLEDLIAEKRFRQDLYYRINVIGLNILPLRDRFEDIEPLVGHFLQKFGPIYGERKLDFDQEAMTALIEYNWPGNVRELENVIESLLALAPQDQVTFKMLPKKIRTIEAKQNFQFSLASGAINFEEAEKVFETEIITKALRKTNYIQTRAAELLGISRRILKYKMDKLGISDHPDTSLNGEEERKEQDLSAPGE